MSLLHLLFAAAGSAETTTLTAGAQSGPSTIGYANVTTAPDLTEMGTVDPTTVRGATIELINGHVFDNDWYIGFDGLHADDNAVWTTCSIQGTFVGGADTKVYTRADADIYSQPGAAYTMWTFYNETDHMIDANEYTITWT